MVAYLDCAASSPPKAESLAESVAVGTRHFANPSSVHSLGREARQLLDHCRKACLQQLGLADASVIFCSCATEANNIVCTSFVNAQSSRRHTFWAGPGLHASLTAPFKQLEQFGHRCRLLPADRLGKVDLDRLALICQGVTDRNEVASMVALNAVDGETGLIQPVEAVAAQLHRVARTFNRRTWVHIDAVQQAPRLPLPAEGWDSLVISGHKMGAVRGIALLLLRRPLAALYRGGGQEGGTRPGTENLVAAFHLTRVLADLEQDRARVAELHRSLLLKVTQLPPCYTLLPSERLLQEQLFAPGLLTLRHASLPGEVLLRMLDQRGVIVGTGSACRNNSPRAATPEYIRVSLAATSRDEELDALAVALHDMARR